MCHNLSKISLRDFCVVYFSSSNATLLVLLTVEVTVQAGHIITMSSDSTQGNSSREKLSQICQEKDFLLPVKMR